eukprot:scaffold6834_cov128-Isochrysis_galbana.AAC.1
MGGNASPPGDSRVSRRIRLLALLILKKKLQGSNRNRHDNDKPLFFFSALSQSRAVCLAPRACWVYYTQSMDVTKGTRFYASSSRAVCLTPPPVRCRGGARVRGCAEGAPPPAC